MLNLAAVRNDKKNSSGTVIQVFGRAFAGMIDMNLEQNYKIHMDFANEPFRITGVSPFSIMGKPDPALQKYADSERSNTRIKADVRKNFDAICERAHCDWFVMDNFSALIGLALINNQFYSLMGGEETNFTDDYYNNNPDIRASYIKPQQEGFSDRLKEQYDLFIEAVLRHYDSDHIILIRSHIPRFWSNNGKIAKTNHSEKTKLFIRQLDDYFAEKVRCAVLYTPAYFFETMENPGDQVFHGVKRWDLQIALERDIILEIENRVKPAFSFHDSSNVKMIANYIADGGTDSILISDYFKCNNYSPEDIVALFWLYEQNKNMLSEIFSNKILSNKNGNVYFHTKTLFERNICTLYEYKYCLINLDDVQFDDKIIVRLDAKHFLEIDKEGLRAFNILPEQEWDYNRFINNNYIFGIADIDDVLESWETYFERGRRRCIDPFILRFNSYEEFLRSLYFLDYADILSNENIVITLPDSEIVSAEYKPKVDASFVFEEETRICVIDAGLGDQINRVNFFMDVCEENDLEIYFHDLFYDSNFQFAGMDVARITEFNMEPRRFSNIFSKRLRYAMRKRKKWFTLDLKEGYIAWWPHKYVPSTVQFPMLFCSTQDILRDFIINKIPSKPIICFTMNRTHHNKKMLYEKYFNFPDIAIEDKKNYEALQLCRSTYAIAIHIRRGDHITDYPEEWKMNVDYKKTLEMVYMQAPFVQHDNKYLFVFSDDMDYVRVNAESLGLTLAGDNVSYVDWNHHFDSFNDMHLISSCKVIIRGIGGFAQSAGLVSKAVQYIISVNDKNVWIEWERSKMISEQE